MNCLKLLLLFNFLGFTNSFCQEINKKDYTDKLRGMWLAQKIANWTGMKTEFMKTKPPFYRDEDWNTPKGRDLETGDEGNTPISFTFIDPWASDDDTDIEYVYLQLMTKYNTVQLTPEQIAEGWRKHINRSIWAAHKEARKLMEHGVLPPATGMGVANHSFETIDTQLSTEFFGAFAPGMPGKALQLANIPIRTSASGYAVHAAQFYALLYAFAPLTDTKKSGKDQVVFLVKEARKYIPSSSKIADITDFVLNDYLTNSDPNNWEHTRDNVYLRYQGEAGKNGFAYQGAVESGINFAASLISLLYGEGDLKRTIQVGVLSGWDSDNGTATIGGLIGLMIGHSGVAAQFPETKLSDRYHISRTRDSLPDYLPSDEAAEDSFTLMAERMMKLVEKNILESGGKSVAEKLILPSLYPAVPLLQNPLELEYRRSANNRIVLEGLSVRASSNAIGKNLSCIADGREGNFSGIEQGPRPQYFKAKGKDIIVAVMYGRAVELKTMRFVEGDGRGFKTVKPEVFLNGAWKPLTNIKMSPNLKDTPFQIIDFILPVPMKINGIRLRGVPANDSTVTVAELDALSSDTKTPMPAQPKVAPLLLPDLVITEILLSPSQPKSGDVVTFSITLHNKGKSPVPDGTAMEVLFLEEEKEISSINTVLKALPAEGDIRIIGSKTWSASSGAHSIHAVADSSDNVWEANEHNNKSELGIEIR